MTPVNGGNQKRLLKRKAGESAWAPLTIDHNPPLHQLVIAMQQAGKLPTLQKLVDLFEQHASEPKDPRKDNPGFSEWCENGMDDALRQPIVTEFLSLHADANFEIVERSENCSKGDDER